MFLKNIENHNFNYLQKTLNLMESFIFYSFKQGKNIYILSNKLYFE
jgi:penicillin-binding protein-related factor A (putative recombinase)